MQNKEAVIQYIKNYSNSPLVFHEVNHPEIEFKPDISNLTLNELVLFVLENTSKYYSKNKYMTETGRGRLRSSLDIWRHVKYFRPNISIFDVMNSLYEIKHELISHYCVTVNRRVFGLRKFYSRVYSLLENEKDEYGMVFIDWENINGI